MIQYVHDHLEEYPEYNSQRKDRKTYCFELPSYKDLLIHVVGAITENKGQPYIIGLKMGTARCHPKDQYRKSTGRLISYSKLEQMPFILAKVMTYTDTNEIILSLKHIDRNIHIKVVLRKSFSNNRILSVYEE